MANGETSVQTRAVGVLRVKDGVVRVLVIARVDCGARIAHSHVIHVRECHATRQQAIATDVKPAIGVLSVPTNAVKIVKHAPC